MGRHRWSGVCKGGRAAAAAAPPDWRSQQSARWRGGGCSCSARLEVTAVRPVEGRELQVLRPTGGHSSPPGGGAAAAAAPPDWRSQQSARWRGGSCSCSARLEVTAVRPVEGRELQLLRPTGGHSSPPGGGAAAAAAPPDWRSQQSARWRGGGCSCSARLEVTAVRPVEGRELQLLRPTGGHSSPPGGGALQLLRPTGGHSSPPGGGAAAAAAPPDWRSQQSARWRGGSCRCSARLEVTAVRPVEGRRLQLLRPTGGHSSPPGGGAGAAGAPPDWRSQQSARWRGGSCRCSARLEATAVRSVEGRELQLLRPTGGHSSPLSISGLVDTLDQLTDDICLSDVRFVRCFIS